MSLAWLWVLNSKVGWPATRISALAMADPATPNIPAVAYAVPYTSKAPLKVEPKADPAPEGSRLCHICFKSAVFVQSDYLPNTGKHTQLFKWLCAEHHASHQGSPGFSNVSRHWCEAVGQDPRLRERLHRYEAEIALPQVDTTKLAQQIEDQIRGTTVVKQAPLNPGYRWLRPWREGSTDIKCLVEYCNAVALVRVFNRKVGVESTTKYVCSQHLAQGIILGAEAIVTTL